MQHSIFISYCRRESPFVDALIDTLEDASVDVWVDYQCLVPGRPWLDQIVEGIERANVFLLVVSKESMTSANVALEIQHALEQRKRIILLIFEAAPLPASLQACEWIDFHKAFGKREKELLAILDEPLQSQPPPPQKGFKTSFIVWMTFLMSFLMLVLSIPGWWTFFLPVLLLPLPIHILRRDFDFYRIRFAILTLPIILLLSFMFFATYETLYIAFGVDCLFSIFFVPLFLFLLTSKGMRMWGKPNASAPRFANPYIPEGRHPVPVPFYVEYAPEDRKYADALIQGLTKYAHPQVNDPALAQANFVLISKYKNSTSIDLENNVVYPVLIQDTQIEDPKMQQIQWIDFRRGIRNLDRMAELLDEPDKLLKALGVAPISGQVAYPRIIQMLDYFLTLLAFFSISAWIPLMAELGQQFLQLANFGTFIIVNIILSVLIFGILFFTRLDLIHRRGRFSSLGWLIASLLLIGIIVFIQSVYIIDTINAITKSLPIVNAVEDMRGSVSLFMPCSCTLGVMLISFFSLWNWRDLTRWFPARS